MDITNFFTSVKKWFNYTQPVSEIVNKKATKNDLAKGSAEKNHDFIAIDVETANADRASICQIGIACYSDGVVIAEWSSLINPEDYFDDTNVDIHGIDEADVKNQPKFYQIYPTLSELLSAAICVSHSSFDKTAIERVTKKYNLPEIPITWLDSTRVVRRTWDECAQKGYGLANVCKIINYKFEHHDALADAKACGAIMLAAMDKSGLTIHDWLNRVSKPIKPARKVSAVQSNTQGPFFGQTILFTGSLQIKRDTASELAAKQGFTVKSSVSKKLDYLVIGDQDEHKLSGKKFSHKHEKALELLKSGSSIKIIKEQEFLFLINHLPH